MNLFDFLWPLSILGGIRNKFSFWSEDEKKAIDLIEKRLRSEFKSVDPEAFSDCCPVKNDG